MKTGILEVLENTVYTLEGTMAGLRRYDKIDGLIWLYKGLYSFPVYL